LTREKRDLEGRLEVIKEELEAISITLKEYLLSKEDLEGVTIGGFNIHLRRELWARKAELATTEEVCHALRASGMGQFVKEEFSTSSLSAHVRQLEREHEAEILNGEIELRDLLPEPLAAVLSVEPTYKVIAMQKQTKRRK